MAPTLPAITRGKPPSSPPPSPRRKCKRKRTPPPELEGAQPKPTPPSAAAPEPPAKNPRAPSPAPPPLPDRRGPPPPGKKKHVPFQRAWSSEDELRILEALAAHRRVHGCLPARAVLFAALHGRLDRKRAAAKDVAHKRYSLKRRYESDANKATPPADDHERRLYILSRDVWGPELPVAEANGVDRGGDSLPEPPIAQDKSAGERAIKDAAVLASNAGERSGKYAAQTKSAGERTGNGAPAPKAKTLVEMRELYPCLVDEAMVLVDPAVLQSVLPSIDHDEAEALNSKINKIRNKLTKAITESARIKNMEAPIEYLHPSTKIQQEKLVENGNSILFECFDKTDQGICVQERLARVQHGILELRQIAKASKSPAKIESNQHHDFLAQGIRSEPSENALQSIVAENQIPDDKKTEAPISSPYVKNEDEVTSKHFYDLHRNNKLQRVRLVHGKRKKIGAGSQPPRHAIQNNTVASMAAPGPPSQQGN